MRSLTERLTSVFCTVFLICSSFLWVGVLPELGFSGVVWDVTLGVLNFRGGSKGLTNGPLGELFTTSSSSSSSLIRLSSVMSISRTSRKPGSPVVSTVGSPLYLAMIDETFLKFHFTDIRNVTNITVYGPQCNISPIPSRPTFSIPKTATVRAKHSTNRVQNYYFWGKQLTCTLYINLCLMMELHMHITMNNQSCFTALVPRQHSHLFYTYFFFELAYFQRMSTQKIVTKH